MSIAEECMVANLSISVWSGQRLDKGASHKVTTDAGAAQDAARVNKHLVPKDTLKAIVAASGALRTHFYTSTLPWRDNGDRLITRRRYMQFMQEHSDLRAEFQAAVDDFVDNTYLGVRDQASFRMGTLFNPDDYPPPDALRRRFGVFLDIDAVTEAGDFRVALDEEHLNRVKLEVQDRTTDRINRAMGDVWTRLADAVGHMADRLRDKDAVFRDSMIVNLRELVALLPDMNFTNDPQLNRIIAQVEATLTQFEPKELRKDDAARAQVAADATAIFDEISGLMRAFGDGEE